MIEAIIGKSFPPAEDSSGFDLSVEFQAGPGITALYGPSGSGKTLTLDAIAGFIAPQAGRIQLNGQILFDAGTKVSIPPRNRACGYVFQNYALFPHMTVRQNLAFAASSASHNLPRLERHRHIAELLERFHLADLAGRKPRELSGGQKQRASIARALITQPKALLLDEPGRGLDGQLRAELYTTLLDLKGLSKIPILLVTHDTEECFALADNVLVYQAGHIVHRGSPLELLRNPGTADVATLLGDFTIFNAEVITLDPTRQTSTIKMLGEEFKGPHLRGCFRGDRVTLCARPEELRIVGKPGDNRIRRVPVRITERPQYVRVDFDSGLIVDVPRDQWTARPDDIWVDVPAAALRQIAKSAA